MISALVYLVRYQGSLWVYFWNHLGVTFFYLIFVFLIVKMKQLLIKEAELSRTDSLTGLANFRSLEEYLEREIEHSRRYGHSLASIYIDCDNFKEVNDTMGHSTGNDLLRVISGKLRSSFRKTDFLARLGGDEFCIILSDINAKLCQEIVLKMKQNLDKIIDEGNWPVTFSIGMAHFPVMPETAEELLRQADQAMYEAKNKGKNQISYRFIQ